MRRQGKAIIRRVLRDDALRAGKHVHTASFTYVEVCHGGEGSSECPLFTEQLEEVRELWQG